MSAGRFASAVVAGILSGGLVAMTGVGRAHAAPVAVGAPVMEAGDRVVVGLSGLGLNAAIAPEKARQQR